MLILVSGATQSVARFADSGRIGRLFCPRDGNSSSQAMGLQWAADNGAYTGFEEVAFLRMLLKLKGLPNCLFVVAPDVVGNWQATSDLFDRWHGTIRSAGFPVAYVAQDGLRRQFVPWSQCDALFIGGSTEFKLSDDAGDVAAEAKRQGKWLHMGRVNTLRRIKRARSWRCDSIDGSGFSMFPDVKIAQAIKWISHEVSQQVMLT